MYMAMTVRLTIADVEAAIAQAKISDFESTHVGFEITNSPVVLDPTSRAVIAFGLAQLELVRAEAALRAARFQYDYLIELARENKDNLTALSILGRAERTRQQLPAVLARLRTARQQLQLAKKHALTVVPDLLRDTYTLTFD